MTKPPSEIVILYRFRLPTEEGLDFELRLDAVTLEQVGVSPGPHPSWTALGFHQCPNCPLDPAQHPHCPVAVSLRRLIDWSGELWSYDKVKVDVVTASRTTTKETAVQTGVSSLLGLVMATSGCPRIAFFRPMARFHLPFPSVTETIYRASSMYLLAQFFLQREGEKPDMELEGLVEIYRQLRIVNRSLADRFRAATEKDAPVNALVLLDLFAHSLPLSVQDSLEDLQHLFAPFFKGAEAGKKTD